MSLEMGRLRALVEARDYDALLEWTDEVIYQAKKYAVEEHLANEAAMHTEVRRVCGPPPETLQERIAHAINATSSENGSNTPDFILAEYLTRCLGVFNSTLKQRAEWYGRMDSPAQEPPTAQKTAGLIVGDVVLLKSGNGPRMTVDRIDGLGSCVCVWFDDNNELKQASLVVAALRKRQILGYR